MTYTTEMAEQVKTLAHKHLTKFRDESADLKLNLYTELKSLDSTLAWYTREVAKAVSKQDVDRYYDLVEELHNGYCPVVAATVTSLLTTMLLASQRERCVLEVVHAEYLYRLELEYRRQYRASAGLGSLEEVSIAKLKLLLYDFLERKQLEGIGFNSNYNLELYKALESVNPEYTYYYQLLYKTVVESQEEAYKKYCNAFAQGSRAELGTLLVNLVTLTLPSQGEVRKQLQWLTETGLQEMMFV